MSAKSTYRDRPCQRHFGAIQGERDSDCLRALQRIESLPAIAGRIVMEDLLQGNIKDVRDSERNFERGRILITFNGVDGLTSNEDTVSEFLLCHGAGAAEFTNGIADSRTHFLPPFLSFDTSIRRHADIR
jgi:hypothetical protein